MTEPRYRFLTVPCTTEQATRLPNNMVVRDVWADVLIVRQRTERAAELVSGTSVRFTGRSA